MRAGKFAKQWYNSVESLFGPAVSPIQCSISLIRFWGICHSRSFPGSIPTEGVSIWHFFFSFYDSIFGSHSEGKKSRKDRFTSQGKRSGVSLNSNWWVEGTAQSATWSQIFPKTAPCIKINRGGYFGKYKVQPKNLNTRYLLNFTLLLHFPIKTSNWGAGGTL